MTETAPPAFFKQERPRTDDYLLLPNCQTVGVKQREGRLEVKAPVDGSLAVAQAEMLEIIWWTVAAGKPASGGPYTSQGGFWAIPAQTALTHPAPNIIYLPVVVAP